MAVKVYIKEISVAIETTMKKSVEIIDPEIEGGSHTAFVDVQLAKPRLNVLIGLELYPGEPGLNIGEHYRDSSGVVYRATTNRRLTNITEKMPTFFSPTEVEWFSSQFKEGNPA